VRAGYGRIVNTTSESVFAGDQLTSYSVAKGAVYAFTRNLATEARPHGIAVNAIAPRAFTRMSAFAFVGQTEEQQQHTAVVLDPELNAPGVAYLAHESCALNGEVLRTGMNSVGRLAVVHTDGVAEAALTPEDVAANLDAILDVAHGTVVDPM
jgi:NAD(P)-dependent dehydrogenase (short-subunit alcohol dehydrogenase family)